MVPESVLKIFASLLGFSVAVECGVLSGLWTLGLRGYHLIHLMLMACLFGLAVALYRQRSRRGAADRAVSLWFAAGLACTIVPAVDFVTSEPSSSNPVTHQLSLAMLFFALGYTCYIVGMWKGLALLTDGKTVVPRTLWLLIPVILAGNVITWITRVQARVADYPILYYGSFVFNATIYVILPWLAIRYLIARRFSLAAVAVMIGAVFIAYSDLVLFDSWFRLPVGTSIPTVLYASNWILYFGGQCLLNVFPSSLAQTLDADTVGRENYTAPQP